MVKAMASPLATARVAARATTVGVLMALLLLLLLLLSAALQWALGESRVARGGGQRWGAGGGRAAPGERDAHAVKRDGSRG
jgi:hypothetical protein